MSRLAHGVESAQTEEERWRSWGVDWAWQSCRGCGRTAECRGTLRRWAYCLPCWLAGMVYVEERRR